MTSLLTLLYGNKNCLKKNKEISETHIVEITVQVIVEAFAKLDATRQKILYRHTEEAKM
jgi:hypothetical protein